MSEEIKFVAGVRRRDGVDQNELFEQWEKVHAPHVVAYAQPLRYTITLFEGRPVRTPPLYDGFAELWFSDRNHYERAFSSDARAERGADSFAELLQPDAGFQLLATEHMFVDSPTTHDNQKVVFFVRRLDEVAESDFFREWREVHGPNVAASVQRSEGCLRYAVTFADQGERGGYDGLPQFWWRDDEARTGGLQGGTADGFDALCAGGTPRLIGRELVIVG